MQSNMLASRDINYGRPSQSKNWKSSKTSHPIVLPTYPSSKTSYPIVLPTSSRSAASNMPNVTPKYQTIAWAQLMRTGNDPDTTPLLTEMRTTLEYTIFNRSGSGPFIYNAAVPANTAIQPSGLRLATLNQTTWFFPVPFRFRVWESAHGPGGNEWTILDQRVDFGSTGEDWADGKEHVHTFTKESYVVELHYQVNKLQ